MLNSMKRTQLGPRESTWAIALRIGGSRLRRIKSFLMKFLIDLLSESTLIATARQAEAFSSMILVKFACPNGFIVSARAAFLGIAIKGWQRCALTSRLSGWQSNLKFREHHYGNVSYRGIENDADIYTYDTNIEIQCYLSFHFDVFRNFLFSEVSINRRGQWLQPHLGTWEAWFIKYDIYSLMVVSWPSFWRHDCAYA
jgi:hypothetical protein